MDRILVTGAAGFLGNHISGLLEKEDAELIAFVRPSSVFDQSRFTTVYDNLDVLLSCESRFTKIFDLAAFIPEDNGMQGNIELVKTNVLQTARLVVAYPEARYIYSSSVAIYGEQKVLPISVKSPSVNPGLYGLSKLAGEAAVRNHPNHAIIRLTSIIGPGMKKKTFLPRIIDQAKMTRLISVWGDGSRMQNYIDVRDASSLFACCAELKSNVVILGVSSRSYSNLEVANIVAELTDSKVELRGSDESISFIFEQNDVFNALNFEGTYSLRDSILEMVEK